MKKLIALFCLLGCMIMFSSCNSSVDVLNNHGRSARKDSLGEVVLTFYYTKPKKSAKNEFAAWLENENGELVYTFMVTDYTVEKGYKKSADMLANWVSKAKPENLSKEEIDLIAQKKVKNGPIECKWDCVDDKGNPLSPGTYTIYLETTTNKVDGLIYVGALTIGNEPSVTYPVPGFKTENSQTSGMILNVKAEFIPKVAD